MVSGFVLPALPYPPARPGSGYWSPVTSTINWCEEDYYLTIYSAEIVNTLTNLLFMALGVRGLRSCIKYRHDTIFLVAFVGYLLVGTGSFLFHSTLKYPMQLIDELSMIYTTCLMCYATFSFSKSHRFRQLLAAGLVSLSLFITGYYHYLQNPIFHQNAFAILTVVVLFRSMWVMEVNIRPSLRARYATTHPKRDETTHITKSKRAANDRRDNQILKDMWLMVGVGISIFLGGFGIWALDNHYCSDLRRWRRQIGLPWGILLEGHGWWHLMTGIGSYFYIIWGIWLRHCLSFRQDEFVLHWPSIFFSLPDIVPATSVESKHIDGSGGSENGYTDRGSKEERKSI